MAMLGPFDYALWLVGFAAELCVPLFAIRQRQFLHYFSLNFYFLALVASEILSFFILKTYGVASLEYRYFYSYTDVLLTVVQFVAIIGLYRHVFDDMEAAKYIRRLAVVVLSVISLVSFLIVQGERSALTTRFAIVLGRNLYFTGMLLTYILWAAMFKRREARTRLLLIVTAFGVFFAGYAVTYALRLLFPGLPVWHAIPPVLGTLLALSLAYTFAKVPEEERIATQHAGGAEGSPACSSSVLLNVSLVLAGGIAAGAQFFVSYCRVFLRSVAGRRVSDDVRSLARLDDCEPSADALPRLFSLLDACPPVAEKRPHHVRLVRWYGTMMRFLGGQSFFALRWGRAWFHREGMACAHFAVVTLDERISAMRNLYERYVTKVDRS